MPTPRQQIRKKTLYTLMLIQMTHENWLDFGNIHVKWNFLFGAWKESSTTNQQIKAKVIKYVNFIFGFHPIFVGISKKPDLVQEHWNENIYT